jgi:hypothetical protein
MPITLNGTTGITSPAIDVTTPIAVADGGTGTTSTTFCNLASNVTGTLPVANGGTGTGTPSLVGGTNITISGSWPNQTVTAAGGAPTTEQVLTATAGLTAGAVGSYMFANRSTVNASLAYNATVAGSQISPSGAIQYAEINAQSAGTTLTGTWRLLGNMSDGSGLNQQFAIRSLFIRIS